jgi:hypothetical protein
MSGTAGATIKLRRDTSANWATANTVLALGEPGLDTTINGIKYGDGVTAWNNLPYSGIVPTATGNLIPALGNTYTLGNAANPWKSLYISGNTIYLGNIQLGTTGNAFSINGNTVPTANGNATFTSVSTTGNVTVAGQISVAGTVTGNYFAGNGAGLSGVVATGIGTLGNLSVTGNVTAGNYVGNGSALTSVMTDRGSDQNNWDTLTQMGVYTVNRTSWSGTQGTPLDSQVFVGLLEVKNSTGTAVEQVFYPGTVTGGNVKIQWNRANWAGSWTAWIKIINDDQVVLGGTY